MEAKTKNKDSKPQSSVAGILLFLFSAAFMLYIIVPNVGTIIDKNVTVGKIRYIDSNSISVLFVAKSDNKEHRLYRKIDSKISNYLKFNDKNIKVVYSNMFPETAYLYAIERDKSIFSIIAILVIILTSYLIIKDDLFNRGS